MNLCGRRAMWRAVGVGLLVLLAMGRAAYAGEDTAGLLSAATTALHEGRAGDAIVSLEALADRGVVDAAVSYDRGLAYALRVRIGAEVPGDLGRAIHGLEEARDLSRDPRLLGDATRALLVLRSEVARRRVRAGEPVEVDPGKTLARTMAGMLSEQTWCMFAMVSSAAFALGLFVQWISRVRRLRISGGVAAGVSAPVLLSAALMTVAARHDRLHLREAVVVASRARPTDEQGIVLPSATLLPEGARVEVLDTRGSLSRIRFGSAEEWVSSTGLRELARRG